MPFILATLEILGGKQKKKKKRVRFIDNILQLNFILVNECVYFRYLYVRIDVGGFET